MNFHTAQSEIAKDTHRFRVVNCGRRFGKTTLAVYEMAAKAMAKDDRLVVYIAPTYQQARDIAWDQLKKIIQPIAVAINESRLECIVKTMDGGKSKIILRGWEAIETMRGMRVDFLVPDEVAMYRNFWLGWQEVLRPTLTDRRGEALFISTPKGFNHFYDLYNLQEKDGDFKSFHFSTYDNPTIPVDEIEKAKIELTADRFAQEYMADFRKASGLVYKEFDRDRHVTIQFPTYFTETLLAVDFGYTNPAAQLPIKVDRDAHYWIREEFYKRGKTTPELIEWAKERKPTVVYPDPAEPDRIEDYRRAGMNVREVSKDVEAGIDKVRELFKQGRIHIHPDCVNLIAELETYSYPEKKPDHNEPEAPIKENDHALDALRYALYMHSGSTRHTVKQFIPNYRH